MIFNKVIFKKLKRIKKKNKEFKNLYIKKNNKILKI